MPMITSPDGLPGFMLEDDDAKTAPTPQIVFPQSMDATPGVDYDYARERALQLAIESGGKEATITDIIDRAKAYLAFLREATTTR